MVLVSTVRYWDFEVERGPAWLFVRPRLAADTNAAEINATAAPAERAFPLADRAFPLADQVWALLEQNFTNRLVLELDALELDRHLVDEMLALDARIAAAEGLLRLCGLSPSNEQMLERYDRHGRLHAFADRSAAVMGRATSKAR